MVDYQDIYKFTKEKYKSREDILHLAVLGDIYYKSACQIKQLEVDLGLDKEIINILLSNLKETGLITETQQNNKIFYILVK